MKKFSVLLGLSASLFAASDEQIISFYSQMVKSQFPDAELSITERKKVADTGFESVIMNINIAGQIQKEILFTKGDIITPDLIDVKNKISYRQEYEFKQFQEAREQFITNAKSVAQKEEMVVSLGDKNKPAIYIFTDPECPYCRDQLENIDEELKNYQVNLILTPVHGKSAFEKSALIYKESKKAKNDAQKIAILKKYYDKNIKTYPKVSDDELKSVFDLYEKYRSLGLRSTPTIIK